LLRTKSSASLVLRGELDELGDSDTAYTSRIEFLSRFTDSAIEFAKHGAGGLILHYQGNTETEVEIRSLQSQVESSALRVVTVSGDIGDPDTSAKVREGPFQLHFFYLIGCPMHGDC